MKLALIVAFTYWAIFVVDESFGWQAFVRPIVCGPIIGFVLGDLKTGCEIGASLEAIYMGIVSVGGGSPADAFGATIICTTFVIDGGLSRGAALALAFPIGTLTQQVTQLALPMHGYFVKKFDQYAAAGDTKKFAFLQQSYRFLIARLFQTTVIFLAILLGAKSVSAVFDFLPKFILTGLTVSGNMLPVVGMGILLSMIWNKEAGAFLFVGFALTAYLKLDTMAVAVFAACIAVIVFFNDSGLQEKLAGLKAHQKAVPAANDNASDSNQNNSEDEEDFFS